MGVLVKTSPPHNLAESFARARARARASAPKDGEKREGRWEKKGKRDPYRVMSRSFAFNARTATSFE